MTIVIVGIVLILNFAACGFGDSEDEDDDSSGGILSAYNWYGNGSANSFTINNATQLAEFAKIVNGTTGESGPAQSDFKGKTVTLTADINLNNQVWESIGSPYGYTSRPFSGTFDGNGKTISGLIATSNANRGLFGFVGENGIIKNVVLINVSISGSENSGGLVGVNYGTVQDSTVSGSVGIGVNIGGIVRKNSGMVQCCHAADSVDGYHIGGVVGENVGTVLNCYAINNVSGDYSTDVVGVVGENDGTV